MTPAVVHTPPRGTPWDLLMSAGRASHVGFRVYQTGLVGRVYQAACGRLVREPDLATTLLIDVESAEPRWLNRPTCKGCQQRMPKP